MKLGERLELVSQLVRDGAVLADVGTDHAYLPIALLESGKIYAAVCSDINEGPLDKARENARGAGVYEKIRFFLTDGARELKDLGVTDYAICGMGGELIASIIENAPHLRDEKINLVLQPMSRHEALRSYLWDSGFEILHESYPAEDGKQYVCMRVRFIGGVTEYSECDAYIGIHAMQNPSQKGAFAYICEKREALLSVIRGKSLGGADASRERAILNELSKRFNNNL